MRNLVTGIWQFYVEGFRSMTLGRTLWHDNYNQTVYHVLSFALFLFPNYLNKAAVGSDKEEYVSRELILRAQENGD